MPQLAHELGVSTRTIQRDIMALTVHYPLETVQGNGGGVILKDYKCQHYRQFSKDEIQVLTELASVADTYQVEILNGLLRKYAG